MGNSPKSFLREGQFLVLPQHLLRAHKKDAKKRGAEHPVQRTLQTVLRFLEVKDTAFEFELKTKKHGK